MASLKLYLNDKQTQDLWQGLKLPLVAKSKVRGFKNFYKGGTVVWYSDAVRYYRNTNSAVRGSFVVTTRRVLFVHEDEVYAQKAGEMTICKGWYSGKNVLIVNRNLDSECILVIPKLHLINNLLVLLNKHMKQLASQRKLRSVREETKVVSEKPVTKIEKEDNVKEELSRVEIKKPIELYWEKIDTMRGSDFE